MQGFYADPADDVTHAVVSDPTAVRTRESYAHVDGDMGSLYLELIERPELTAADLVTSERSAQDVSALLQRLSIIGLLELDQDGIHVLPPDNALPARAVQLERRAAAARSAVSELARRYYVARSEGTRDLDQLVRLLYSVEEIGAASSEMIAMGVSSIVTLRAPTQRILMIAGLPPEVRALPLTNAQGVTLTTRVVYDSRLLAAIPMGTDVLLERAHHEQQRFSPDLPWTVTVVDDRAAIIDIGFPGRGAPAGMLLRTPVFVEPVLWLVERFWQYSVPVPRAGMQTTLDKRDQYILGMLASGASDATIARQTGVSLRTIERRIKLILDQLGAQSRFQAGLLAKERGWL